MVERINPSITGSMFFLVRSGLKRKWKLAHSEYLFVVFFVAVVVYILAYGICQPQNMTVETFQK